MAQGNQRGFTLLELMISITLLGMIVLITASAMRLGYRSLESGEKKAEEVERLMTSVHLMDGQIQSILLTRSTEGDQLRYPLSGGPESITFPSNYSLFNGQRGYVMVTYTVVTEGKGQFLTASEGAIGMEEKSEARLMGPFDRIAFEYFFRDSTEEEGAWVGEWTDTATLPEKVRLRLTKGTSEVSLILPVRVGGPGEQKPVTDEILKEITGQK